MNRWQQSKYEHTQHSQNLQSIVHLFCAFVCRCFGDLLCDTDFPFWPNAESSHFWLFYFHYIREKRAQNLNNMGDTPLWHGQSRAYSNIVHTCVMTCEPMDLAKTKQKSRSFRVDSAKSWMIFWNSVHAIFVDEGTKKIGCLYMRHH